MKQCFVYSAISLCQRLQTRISAAVRSKVLVQSEWCIAQELFRGGNPIRLLIVRKKRRRALFRFLPAWNYTYDVHLGKISDRAN